MVKNKNESFVMQTPSTSFLKNQLSNKMNSDKIQTKKEPKTLSSNKSTSKIFFCFYY